MIKKIKDLTITECKAICSDQTFNSCQGCPLWIAGTSACIKDIKILLENEVEVDE